ncbi:hypothetical protein [Streptococcus acidominimus]|nr:hypothetical protein [Streptococcus acidominimus]MBF0818890.1 hypothetical protein [Streptococcus acidominimus]MBF0839027.1 hypothetical protein [Streptococcus acidominimus]MBF0846044.1 hypothetical protein [Streptococcus danieliae]
MMQIPWIVLLFPLLIWSAVIATIVYFFRCLHRIIRLLEEIKEQHKKD